MGIPEAASQILPPTQYRRGGPWNFALGRLSAGEAQKGYPSRKRGRECQVRVEHAHSRVGEVQQGVPLPSELARLSDTDDAISVLASVRRYSSRASSGERLHSRRGSCRGRLLQKRLCFAIELQTAYFRRLTIPSGPARLQHVTRNRITPWRCVPTFNPHFPNEALGCAAPADSGVRFSSLYH